MFVTKVVIVDNGQSIRVFFLSSEIEWVNMVLRILNIKGYLNYMIGSKVTMILTMFFVHD